MQIPFDEHKNNSMKFSCLKTLNLYKPLDES